MVYGLNCEALAFMFELLFVSTVGKASGNIRCKCVEMCIKFVMLVCIGLTQSGLCIGFTSLFGSNDMSGFFIVWFSN